jgi:pimeloyl-[acyl-carrier protein] methyl ester esterase
VGSPIPKLVLLPGMDGTGNLFEGFIKALPDGFETRIVRYPPDAVQSYDELLKLVQGAISGSGPFVLFAESFSTPLAIRCAAGSPPNLRGLILCAGFASSPLRGWKRWACRSLTPFLFRGTAPAFAVRQFLVGPGASPELVQAVRKAVSFVKPRVLRGRVRSVIRCDARRELAQVSVPVYYLRAGKDRLVPVLLGEEIQRVNPRAKVESITGPHLILQREPQKCADAVARFVTQLDP